MTTGNESHMSAVPQLSLEQIQFAADYPPSGQCPAKAVDQSQEHIWTRDSLGEVQCAECYTPYPEDVPGPLAESDLDFLQRVCDAQGPLYAGTYNPVTQRREYRNGVHLVDDEEGDDLTFYLVARLALPAVLTAYRLLRDQLDEESARVHDSDVIRTLRNEDRTGTTISALEAA
jgi:hypothetical protein